VKNRKDTITLALVFSMAVLLFGTLPAFGQDITDTSVPLDESLLFGADSTILTVIDTDVASTSVIDLVDDTKTYPVFLVEGSANVSLRGTFFPYGAGLTDAQSLLGAVNIRGFSLTFLPSKDIQLETSASASILPSGAETFAADASADMRASEFVRLHASLSFDYEKPDESSSEDNAGDGLAIEEVFLDTSIERSVFFRIGKQRISWGVGNWFKPADVLSLSAIDPDDPGADRDGPFAVKVDVPFGLNHATLYIVPPVDSEDLGQFSAAQRTDFVVGGFELSLAGFYRSDFAAKPRAMLMFTGTAGNFDLYGENVVLWGADRLYVRADGLGGYETFRVENTAVFQSTLGAKYSYSSSDGLGINLHVQAYYNGSGYEDSSILRVPAAAAAISATDGYLPSDLSRAGAGMYYLAGSVSMSARFGEGASLTNISLGGYGLANFSDGSARFKPSLDLSIGSEGSKFTLQLSALASLGVASSEYAPQGTMVTPALSTKLFNDISLTLSAPLNLDSGLAVTKAQVNFSLDWSILDLE